MISSGGASVLAQERVEGKKGGTKHYQRRNNTDGLLNRQRQCSFLGHSENGYHFSAACPMKRESPLAPLESGLSV